MNFLKISKSFLTFITIFFGLTAYSQTNSTEHPFPISGLFKVQKNELNEPKRYNYIDFKEDTYALMQDDKNLYVFQAIDKINDVYTLKQLTFGDHVLVDNGKEKTTIQLKIIQIEESQYELSFIFPNRTEKIILIKE